MFNCKLYYIYDNFEKYMFLVNIKILILINNVVEKKNINIFLKLLFIFVWLEYSVLENKGFVSGCFDILEIRFFLRYLKYFLLWL